MRGLERSGHRFVDAVCRVRGEMGYRISRGLMLLRHRRAKTRESFSTLDGDGQRVSRREFIAVLPGVGIRGRGGVDKLGVAVNREAYENKK